VLNEKFETAFADLITNEQTRTGLGQKIKELALPNATGDIVDEVEKLISTR